MFGVFGIFIIVAVEPVGFVFFECGVGATGRDARITGRRDACRYVRNSDGVCD
jgi:hypothetical protein